MNRIASLALVTATMLLTTQSASATVNLNDRISQIVNGLRNNAHFYPRDFSLILNGRSVRLFTGLEGIRKMSDDPYLINEWANEQPAPAGLFDGKPYKFTHSVLGSFFDAEEKPVNPVFNGAPYKFTHEVLGSYFDAPSPPSAPVPQAMLIEPPVRIAANIAPVPEPASWALMIGGFALAGAALRNRRMTVRLA